MSLASNNEFTQVFQAIVSALHSLHQLHGVAIAILLYIGRGFASACAAAGCSLSMSNCSDTCDSLHVINLASDVVSIAAIYFFRGISYLTLCIYLVAHH